MTFASNAFGQLRYIEETVRNTTPVAGNGINLRMTQPTLKAAISTVKSEEVRADRLSTGSTRTDLNIDGGFNFELSGKEYDPFLCNLLGQAAFTHYGTLGLGTSFSMTSVAGSITAAAAPTTTSAFTTLGLSEWFKVVPPVGATQAVKDYFADRWFKTHASTPSTSTVITLDPSTPIAAPGILTTQAGYSISKSSIVNGNTFKSYTLEYALTDIGKFLPFTGMQTGSMDLSLDVGSIVKGSFGFIGQGHGGMVSATTLPGSPVASQTLEVMNSVADVGAIYENGTSILGATSFIKSMKFNINGNLRGQKALGVMGNAGIGLGELALSGTMDVYLEDAAYYTKWFSGTNTSLAVGVADSAGNGYLIELDKVTFKDVSTGGGGRNDDAMLSLPFDAFYSANTSRGIRITRAVSA